MNVSFFTSTDDLSFALPLPAVQGEGEAPPIDVIRVGTFTDMNKQTVTITQADLDAFIANHAANTAGQDVLPEQMGRVARLGSLFRRDVSRLTGGGLEQPVPVWSVGFGLRHTQIVTDSSVLCRSAEPQITGQCDVQSPHCVQREQIAEPVPARKPTSVRASRQGSNLTCPLLPKSHQPDLQVPEQSRRRMR